MGNCRQTWRRRKVLLPLKNAYGGPAQRRFARAPALDVASDQSDRPQRVLDEVGASIRVLIVDRLRHHRIGLNRLTQEPGMAPTIEGSEFLTWMNLLPPMRKASSPVCGEVQSLSGFEVAEDLLDQSQAR